MEESIVSWDSMTDPGLCTLLYGPFGVGKTDALLTMPGELLLYSTEPKDIKRTVKEHLKRNKQKDRKITIKHFDDFDGYMDDINALQEMFSNGDKPFDSIGFDTLSFFQQETKLDMEDSRYGDALKDGKRDETLVDRFRIEQADWGGIKSAMTRLTRALNNISKFNVYVTVTAAMLEHPKFDRTLEGGPAFEGGFAVVSAGFFDLVGAVMPGENEEYPYPARVTFNHPDFVTRCCSDALMKKQFGPLDMGKIIKVVEK